jgi:hypothetical protein
MRPTVHVVTRDEQGKPIAWWREETPEEIERDRRERLRASARRPSWFDREPNG